MGRALTGGLNEAITNLVLLKMTHLKYRHRKSLSVSLAYIEILCMFLIIDDQVCHSEIKCVCGEGWMGVWSFNCIT